MEAHTQNLRNIGLPLLASPFVYFYPYHQTLIFLSLLVSVLIIPISFIFFRKYLDEKFSLLAVFLLSFDFRIIQNSVMGITEPLMLIFGIGSLAVKDQRVAFLLAGMATFVRFEAIVFFIYLVILYIYTNKKLPYLPIFLFSIIILIIISLSYPVMKSNIPFIPIETKGTLINSILHFGWAFIPFFILTPFGLYKKPKLLLPLIFFALPGLYSYLFAFDMRYFFPAFVFMALLSTIGIKAIIEIHHRLPFK